MPQHVHAGAVGQWEHVRQRDKQAAQEHGVLRARQAAHEAGSQAQQRQTVPLVLIHQRRQRLPPRVNQIPQRLAVCQQQAIRGVLQQQERQRGIHQPPASTAGRTVTVTVTVTAAAAAASATHRCQRHIHGTRYHPYNVGRRLALTRCRRRCQHHIQLRPHGDGSQGVEIRRAQPPALYQRRPRCSQPRQPPRHTAISHRRCHHPQVGCKRHGHDAY